MGRKSAKGVITSYSIHYTKLYESSPSTKITCAGQGVYAGGVAQIRDPFLDRRYRELNADALEAGTKSGVLIDVENALDNIDTDGIENAMMEFRKAMSSFATDSTDRRELANILTQSAKKIVNIFNGYDAKLEQIRDQTQFEIDTNIRDFNATIDKIADLNKQIVNNYIASGEITTDLAGNYTVNATYGPNELLDTRNVLLDSLSGFGNIEIANNADGSTTVKLAGVTVVDYSTSTARNNFV